MAKLLKKINNLNRNSIQRDQIMGKKDIRYDSGFFPEERVDKFIENNKEKGLVIEI